MSTKTFVVKFTGLFALIRHAAGPTVAPARARRTTRLPSEPMTIVFPVDDDASGAMKHGSRHATKAKAAHAAEPPAAPMHMHASQITVPIAAGLDDLRKILGATGDAPRGFETFPLDDMILHLPRDSRRQAVSHPYDEQPFDANEPTADMCPLVADDQWAPLSRLANLGTVVESQLHADVLNPQSATKRLQTIVNLSGGYLECERPTKKLGKAFFEFFDQNTGTILVQPAAEDIRYTREISGQYVTIGLSRFANPDVIYNVRLKVIEGQPLIIKSLPPAGFKSNSLNHFRNYIKLMQDRPGRKDPFVRMLARCAPPYGSKSRRATELVHTFPANTRTVDTCSCLAAQAFMEL